MDAPLQILMIEDSVSDARIIEHTLRRDGIEFTATRVVTEEALRAALAEGNPQIVLADYNVPGFRGDAALAVARERSQELPVIFVSGTIGEERAVELMRAGATDYVLKEHIERLPFAVRRALEDKEHRDARRRAEEAERRGGEMLSLALDGLQMGTWNWDLVNGEIEFSDRCRQIFGLLADEQMDYERMLPRLPPEDRTRLDEAVRQTLAARMPHDLEFRVIWPDGSTHWVVSRGRAFYDEATGAPLRMTGTAMDITARKDAEQERERVEKKLREAQKLESLGVLAGGIAHDFNNLLTGVLGTASLARMDSPADSPILPYLDDIEEAATRAADLCRQMLAYAGKGRFVIQEVDLSAIVSETTHLLQSSIGKSVVLKMDLAEGLPAVSGDAAQIRQIVMNLVINASEAIGQKSGVVTVSTSLVHADRALLDASPAEPELPEGDYIHLQVGDTGSGMPPETLARIFDPFFTTKFTGRGLGLAAVLGIVHGHKGTLKVASEPGQGTVFDILLPCAAEPAAPRAKPDAGAHHWRGSGTVLLVDDERTVRVIIGRMLEAMGFTVITANDGREAVERFRAEGAGIRAVLLDLTMPHLDGEGAFRELRLLRPEVRVLLMSGYNEHEAMNRFIGKGLAGFLQKPFKTENLRARLEEILS